MEAVVRDEDDGGVRSCEVEQALEHHVVRSVGALDHVLVDLKVFIGDAVHLWWMVVHEMVADLINGAVVDGHEVPVWICLHEVGGGGVHGVCLTEVLAEVVDAVISGLVNLMSCGEEGLDDVAIDLVGGDAKFVHRLREVFWPVGAGHRFWPVGWVLVGLGAFEMDEHVRDHFAVEVLLPLSGEPGDDVAAEFFFSEHLPEGLALSRRSRHGDDLT